MARTLEVIGQGSCIGTYTVLNIDNFSFFACAKTNCTLLRLSREDILNMRRRYEEVDQEMTVHEEYVDEHGVPACDYRILRTRANKGSLLDKLRLGVNRINKLKAGESKRPKITDILKTVQDLALQ